MPPTARCLLTVCAGLPAALLIIRIALAYAPGALGRRTRAAAVAAVMLTFAWVSMTTPWGPVFVASLGLAWTLACLALIDLIAFRLPDAFTLPLILAGLVVSTVLPGRPIVDHLVGGAVGWALLEGVAWVYLRLRGREGLGAGDAKLLAAGGAWLGWAALPSVILMACAASVLWVAVCVARRGRPALGDRLAFGTPLCGAILFVWLEGPLIL